jgi:glycosyltransferase involved in cell wall biosynthesis
MNIIRYGAALGYRSERLSLQIIYKPLAEKFDIAHVHSGISMATVAGYWYARVRNTPLIVTWHGDSVREPAYNRYVKMIPRTAAFLYKYFINKVLAEAHAIISVSPSTVDESPFLRRYKDKVHVIPNGVNVEEFDLKYGKEECKAALGLSGRHVILFVGSIHQLKGIDTLLEAILKIVGKVQRDVVFVLVGAGDISHYEQMACDLGVDSYVKFTGYVGAKKPLYYGASDIFVLPSFTEAFPLVILEAMASGLPIVASRVGGIPDIVTEKIGILVRPGDPHALAEAIYRLIVDQSTSLAMGLAGRQSISAYSWKKIAEDVEKLFSDVHSTAITEQTN